VLKEKPNVYDKRKSQTTTNAASGRLSKCAVAVRMAVSRGLSKLGRKTLLAVIDHITQVLPGPHGDFVQPLLQDYIKALTEVLSRQANVEVLARKDGAAWETCIDFFLDLVQHIVPNDVDDASLPVYARASPAPGTANPRLTGRSTQPTQSQQIRTVYSEGGPLRDVLEGILHLLSGANAPIVRRQKEIIDVVLKVLRMKKLSLGSIQTLCFAISNHVFEAIQSEELDDATTLIDSLVPLMAYWWRAEKVSQDELIRALRNEISKMIFLTQLHLEHIAKTSQDGVFHANIEELADRMWMEYTKRGEAFRLQLGDISFSLSSLPDDYLHHSLFGLRPHNTEGESYWAIVQNLAFLETILLRSKSSSLDQKNGHGEQPQKKRRIRGSESRIRLKLRSQEAGVRRTALQLLPFMLTRDALNDEEASALLSDLSSFATHKDTITASWALLACAR
jgi:serine-protein kinase ATM